MKKTSLAVLIAPLILLVGCSDDEKMFKAASDSWEGELFVQEVNDEQQVSYTFTYTGDDLAEQADNNYNLFFKGPQDEHTRNNALGEEGIITTNSPSSCTNCLQDGELNATVTIELDGRTEEIVFTP